MVSNNFAYCSSMNHLLPTKDMTLSQAGERHNARLDTLIRSLPHLKHSGDTTRMDHPLALAWLQPRDIDTFYSYRGSLTTPPCSEAVTWLLFPSALHVSFDQVQYLSFKSQWFQNPNCKKKKKYIFNVIGAREKKRKNKQKNNKNKTVIFKYGL